MNSETWPDREYHGPMAAICDKKYEEMMDEEIVNFKHGNIGVPAEEIMAALILKASGLFTMLGKLRRGEIKTTGCVEADMELGDLQFVTVIKPAAEYEAEVASLWKALEREVRDSLRQSRQLEQARRRILELEAKLKQQS